MSGRHIELPGGISAHIEAPPTRDQELLAAIAQNLHVAAQTLDVMLQLQCRIALGWDPAEAIVDLKLNVPAPPPSAPNRAQRRAAERNGNGAAE